MWSSYSVTGPPPVTGTANGNSSESGGEDSSHVVDGGTDSDPLLGLVALQLTVLVFISAVGTFANALVFAVFYRRPSLRTISNRFVLSLIMANLTSAAVSIPGHVYQLLIKPLHQEQRERFQGHHQFHHHYQSDVVNNGVNADSSIGEDVTYIMGRLVDDSTSSWLSSWHWHKQGLDGLTVLVSLASVLSILLISLDRYYAVNSPLHYSIIVTRQKSMAMIALVWMVAAILSAPVWAGSVLLQHYAPITSTIRTPPYSSTAHSNNKDSVFDNSALMNNETLYGASDGEQFNINSSRDQQNQQQYLMNLCYSVSLILFGFVWPLAALCWLYLRMYEAALKNSARTRRQSLCSNTNNNANAMDGTVGAAAVAAASTVAATASSNADPCFSSYGTTTMAGSHHSTLADAITSVTTTAAALASENQASMRLLAAASAAAASASTPHRHRSNRYWMRLNGMQQQLLRLFWREQGRPLRTTAMVISSFTCCWLPFFVWLLPFQIHPSLIAATKTTTLDHVEPRPTVTAASAGIFLARLAAFSNVLISPAIYVYRNQVAQREAGRVLLLLFCPLRHHRGQSTRYNSHDIATPLVMGGLGVGGMTTSQLHHPHSGESRLRRNSNAVNSSRRSSSLVTNNSTDSPTRKGSAEPMTVLALAQATVVNWRGRSGSTDCRLLTRNNGAGLLADEASVAQQQPILCVGPSPQLAARQRRFSNNKSRASIPGACCTYSLDRRPSTSSSHMDAHPPMEMRQRSQTISEARLTSSSRLLEHPAALSPHISRVDPLTRTEGVATNTSFPNVITLGATASTTSSCVPSDRSRSKKRLTSSSTTAAAAAAAAAAVAAAELKALNHPLAYYPSLDFFDIGLEDYGRRSATSSFSRFIQQQPAPLIPTQTVSSFPQQQTTTSAMAVPLAQTVSQSCSSTCNNGGRRRRTCSFSKVMSRGSKQPTSANTRWPAVFGSTSKQQQQEILTRSSASSMPSVQQIPSLVTAV